MNQHSYSHSPSSHSHSQSPTLSSFPLPPSASTSHPGIPLPPSPCASLPSTSPFHARKHSNYQHFQHSLCLCEDKTNSNSVKHNKHRSDLHFKSKDLSPCMSSLAHMSSSDTSDYSSTSTSNSDDSPAASAGLAASVSTSTAASTMHQHRQHNLQDLPVSQGLSNEEEQERQPGSQLPLPLCTLLPRPSSFASPSSSSLPVSSSSSFSLPLPSSDNINPNPNSTTASMSCHHHDDENNLPHESTASTRGKDNEERVVCCTSRGRATTTGAAQSCAHAHAQTCVTSTSRPTHTQSAHTIGTGTDDAQARAQAQAQVQAQPQVQQHLVHEQPQQQQQLVNLIVTTTTPSSISTSATSAATATAELSEDVRDSAGMEAGDGPAPAAQTEKEQNDGEKEDHDEEMEAGNAVEEPSLLKGWPHSNCNSTMTSTTAPPSINTQSIQIRASGPSAPQTSISINKSPSPEPTSPLYSSFSYSSPPSSSLHSSSQSPSLSTSFFFGSSTSSSSASRIVSASDLSSFLSESPAPLHSLTVETTRDQEQNAAPSTIQKSALAPPASLNPGAAALSSFTYSSSSSSFPSPTTRPSISSFIDSSSCRSQPILSTCDNNHSLLSMGTDSDIEISDIFNSGRELHHPHITYPNMLQEFSQHDCGSGKSVPLSTSTSATIASMKSAMSAERIDINANGDTQLTISPYGSRQSTAVARFSSQDWDMQRDRSNHRGNSSFDQEESDDPGHESGDGMEADNSSDSETERKRAPEQSHSSHRPVSMKRRKVSEDEDDSQEEDEDQRMGVSYTPDASSPPPNDSLPILEFSSAPSSPQKPPSWPARKRRSILAEPSSTFSVPSQSMKSSPTVDTSSLSLLSATSAMISDGAIPSPNNDAASRSDSVRLRPLLLPPASPSPPSSSSSSSSLSSSSASSPIETRFSSVLDDFTYNFTDNSRVRSTTKTALPSFCRHLRYCSMLLGSCRKRSFEDAIELTRPLGGSNNPSAAAAELHLGWFGSIKRRKIHHFPTRWTSALSPSPYVKLMAMRDFWDVMHSRLDLSWLDLLTASNANSRGFYIETQQEILEVVKDEAGSTETVKETIMAKSTFVEEQGSCIQSSTTTVFESNKILETRMTDTDEDAILGVDGRWPLCRSFKAHSEAHRRTVVQHPSTGLLLRGLWEEEERGRRQRQMIPECVHKPMRSKILNRKPIPRLNIVMNQAAATSSGSWIRPKGFNVAEKSSSSSSSSSSESLDQSAVESGYESDATKVDSDSDQESTSSQQRSQQNQTSDQEMMLRKKHGPTAAVRSNALSEGYDLNEYKPWRDGTITPHTGGIRELCHMRSRMMDPWPKEESRAKDECTRMLHRMREQLNVVINLQIHLRSMIKTTPSHTSFLLSIRHPGQVSVELLNALYGPQFMQTSAFRSIEQLLWGKYTPARIEHHQSYHHHHNHHQQHQQQQGSGASEQGPPTPTHPYGQSQAREYRYNDQEEVFEGSSETHTDNHHHQSQYHHHRYQEHQERRYHQHHQSEIDDETECEFEEEFDEQPYQDSMLDGTDPAVVVASHRPHNKHHQDYQLNHGKESQATQGKGMDGQASQNEVEIESLAVISSSRRRDSGMVIDMDEDLRC